MQATASQLYDYIACPQRVYLDLHGDEEYRDEVSPFVRLLWERGSAYEARVIADLTEQGVLSLRGRPDAEREKLTREAITNRVPLIYGGRLSADDVLGEPDLLILRGEGYLPADIKSGRGEEGDPDEGDIKPKAHYAVQLGLYVDILERLGLGIGHVAEVWDINGDHVLYELDQRRHSRTEQTWWDFYRETLAEVHLINNGTSDTRGALSSVCKLCHWYTNCRGELISNYDLSLVPSLGRALRDTLSPHFADLREFAAVDLEALIDGKKTSIAGLGPDRLRLFHARAKLLCANDASPYLRQPVSFPVAPVEVFFDIEADPMNDIVYLHGFVERNVATGDERYFGFFAEACSVDAEREAFAQAIGWLRERPSAPVYYYSKYERTMYRKLCARHSGVTSVDEIEILFTPPRAIDLYYDVVFRATEWPTYDHSIKTLAKWLGFSWRDTDPSGAASIEWYQRWVQTGDVAVRERIIQYNEDDCRATAVVLDGIRGMA